MPALITTEEFIARSTEKHSGRYLYSLARYIDSRTKVEIICPVHGSFWQRPQHHWRGIGCSACSRKRRLTIETFIERSIATHGERYNYSNSVYVNDGTSVEIKCDEHGAFWQLPRTHYDGAGCPHCAGVVKLNLDSFIKLSVERHGARYDYSKSRFMGRHLKVDITCPEHGVFRQIAKDHYSGSGCPACGRVARGSTETFISRAVAAHGHKYDYSRAIYKSTRSKIEIVCPDHGPFFQSPISHYNGNGCPLCPHRYADPCAIYVMASADGKAKIGISRDPAARLPEVARYAPAAVTLHSFEFVANHSEARRLEAQIHSLVSEKNCCYTGFDGASEWFEIAPCEASALVRDAIARSRGLESSP